MTSSNRLVASLWPRRPTLFVGVATLWSLPGFVPALELGEGFDLAALTTHGIDPKVSDYFRSAARFREGTHVVGLRVNGSPLGLVDAQFDSQGQLCFTAGLLEKAGLVNPGGTVHEGVASGPACQDFLGAFPTTMVRLRPGSNEVALVVPTQSLREPQWEAAAFSRGGAAALFNYDVQGFDSHSRGGPSRFVSAYTEAGFNLGDWIVRSRQFYVSDNGNARTEHLYAYAQRDIAALQSTFQAGQISSNNPLFGGIQLSGVQFSPDGQSRVPSGSNSAVVEGLAQSQSRIEVRQSGVLVHSTLVPEGPFRLTGLPLLNGTSDLEVSVIDVRGAKRNFVVPAASFAGAAPAAPGYYFSLGKVRENTLDEAPTPVVAMGSGTWGLGRDSSAGFGLLSTDEYWSAGGALSSVFFQRVSVGARHNLSRDNRGAVSGSRSSVTVSSPVAANIDLNLSSTLQTRGYREVLEAGRPARADELGSRFKHQYTAGMSWVEPTLGVFSLGYTRSAQFDGQTSEHVFAAWNKSFRYADVALVADSQVGGSQARFNATRDDSRGERGLDNDLSMRLQVSVPLGGERRVNSYVSRRGNQARAGTAFSERVNDYVRYEVGTERDFSHREQSVRGQLDLMPRYTRLGLGVSRDGQTTSYTGQLQGGVVAHEGGLTFSPYTVQDTFGIASVGDIGAARIDTPQGPVWTDFKGQAVIPGLPAYTRSRIEVQTQSLPKRVDLKNGTQVLVAGRGSVNTVAFEVVKVRRVLLTASDQQGRPLPQGASVFDKHNRFLTSVVGEGMIFLNDLNDAQNLRVSMSDSSSCVLNLASKAQPDNDKFYETGSAVCHGR
ncbi:outer membrane usher protein [Pseudomonas sp. BCA14]|uniref:fimbria/pilus outer membrane usher protein n=1 Tax=unclassified Pseudomonas TaxID=196821 RepID=UPI00106E4F56|nr:MULTISPECIES: fimbria/pilus outer membrane usher protein [unclassified Pseudomonas]TFF07372.1 outer membrane usher protein [Pseudomonas sp. JMN1]TFF10933.1 outer membrane usher protein [Pseudomonas sp. BCA17]TFF22544.1 outer membrane usher protein [Pseudomonas sp. BCA13]TFF26398.1 outer membrane usher protein [Pseudomonas sp. BCA14]